MLSGVTTACILAPDIISGMLVILGSTAPDRLDACIAGGDKKVWGAVHRGASHNPWYAAALCFLVVCACHGLGIKYDVLDHVGWYFCWFSGGVLLHLAFDIFTPSGIPCVPFSARHFSLRLVTTGHASDYLFGLVYVVGCLFYAAHSGRLKAVHYWLLSFSTHPTLNKLSNIIFSGGSF